MSPSPGNPSRAHHQFEQLVKEHHESMLRLARRFVRTTETAEEVVQEAWIAILRGISGFEGRSTLKTWIYRIVTNQALTHARRDARMVPFSSVRRSAETRAQAPIEDTRETLFEPGMANEADPEEAAILEELKQRVAQVLDTLPPRQRDVLVARSLQGRSSAEVRAALRISANNQRVLLHRGRSRLQEALAFEPGR